MNFMELLKTNCTAKLLGGVDHAASEIIITPRFRGMILYYELSNDDRQEPTNNSPIAFLAHWFAGKVPKHTRDLCKSLQSLQESKILLEKEALLQALLAVPHDYDAAIKALEKLNMVNISSALLKVTQVGYTVNDVAKAKLPISAYALTLVNKWKEAIKVNPECKTNFITYLKNELSDICYKSQKQSSPPSRYDDRRRDDDRRDDERRRDDDRRRDDERRRDDDRERDRDGGSKKPKQLIQNRGATKRKRGKRKQKHKKITKRKKKKTKRKRTKKLKKTKKNKKKHSKK